MFEVTKKKKKKGRRKHPHVIIHTVTPDSEKQDKRSKANSETQRPCLCATLVEVVGSGGAEGHSVIRHNIPFPNQHTHTRMHAHCRGGELQKLEAFTCEQLI